jgi:hypothetical protein
MQLMVLAKAVGISVSSVQRIWKAHGLHAAEAGLARQTCCQLVLSLRWACAERF